MWKPVLSEMGSLLYFNHGVKYLLCVIDALPNMLRLNHRLMKKPKTVLNGFIEIVNKSKCKPNQLCIDQLREFYNSLIHKWVDDNDDN